MMSRMTYLLLHSAKEAAYPCCPGTARYGFVCILYLGIEVAGRLVLGAAAARLLLGGILRVAFLLYVVVCRIHGDRYSCSSWREVV